MLRPHRPLQGTIEVFAPTASFTLRAHAATILLVFCGLSAAIRCVIILRLLRGQSGHWIGHSESPLANAKLLLAP